MSVEVNGEFDCYQCGSCEVASACEAGVIVNEVMDTVIGEGMAVYDHKAEDYMAFISGGPDSPGVAQFMRQIRERANRARSNSVDTRISLNRLFTRGLEAQNGWTSRAIVLDEQSGELQEAVDVFAGNVSVPAGIKPDVPRLQVASEMIINFCGKGVCGAVDLGE